jgi:hypothetical protein
VTDSSNDVDRANLNLARWLGFIGCTRTLRYLESKKFKGPSVQDGSWPALFDYSSADLTMIGSLTGLCRVGPVATREATADARKTGLVNAAACISADRQNQSAHFVLEQKPGFRKPCGTEAFSKFVLRSSSPQF